MSVRLHLILPSRKHAFSNLNCTNILIQVCTSFLFFLSFLFFCSDTCIQVLPNRLPPVASGGPPPHRSYVRAHRTRHRGLLPPEVNNLFTPLNTVLTPFNQPINTSLWPSPLQSICGERRNTDGVARGRRRFKVCISRASGAEKGSTIEP